ncbi:MAG: hypothetical protein JST30_00600 [Armatimonadetes bacterium]|nr:hypothetical protein [Armatimonadota bacterium]
MQERRYDEKDVAKIIQRAAEIQAGTLPSGESGTTLSEIKRVAAEIGIDPQAVEVAAAERGPGPLARSEPSSGPSSFDETFFGEMDADRWDECVALFRNATGRAGTVDMAPGRFEWTGGTEGWGMTVTATVRNGKTRVRLMGRTDGGTAIIWTLCLALGFMASLATGGIVSKFNPAGAAFGAASGVAALVVAVAVLLERRFTRSGTRTFRETLRSVAEILTRPEPDAASTVRPTEVAGADVVTDIVQSSG